MANIAISDLNSVELEFAELSHLELEAVMGGKGPVKNEIGVEGGYSQKDGASTKVLYKRTW